MLEFELASPGGAPLLEKRPVEEEKEKVKILKNPCTSLLEWYGKVLVERVTIFLSCSFHIFH